MKNAMQKALVKVNRKKCSEEGRMQRVHGLASAPRSCRVDHFGADDLADLATLLACI